MYGGSCCFDVPYHAWLQVALNDVDVSMANIQKLAKEFEVRVDVNEEAVLLSHRL